MVWQQAIQQFLSLVSFVSSLMKAFALQCCLPNPVAEQLVSTALTFLGSGYDPARRNGAQFLAIALRVRCMLAEFERQGGQSRLLHVLRATLILLRMPSSGDARMEKQVNATQNFSFLRPQ